MAGGYKLFSTGEVLTAANVNNYLMNQTVMVFASAAARTTALSGVLAEGMISYRSDAKVLEIYNGTSWITESAFVSPLTTKGDVHTYSTTDARLGVGTTNQTLIVDSTQTTGLKWAASPQSTLSAKGSLVSASAANTLAELTVGTDGQTLVANSAATTGLQWASTPSASNPILNSAMQVWQRGTSIACTTTSYTADRWQGYRSVAGATVSRQATGDTTNLPNIQYCARVQRDSGNTATTYIDFLQTFESANSIPYAGKTITLSFYARKGANYSPTTTYVVLKTGTGTDQNVETGFTGSVTAIGVNQTFTTTWARYTFTATLDATATQLGVYLNLNPLGTAGAADYLDVTGFQIDIGSVALPFRTFSQTLQGELQACRRYLPAYSGGNNDNIMGYSYATNNAIYGFQFDTPARVYPTGITATGTFYGYANNTQYTITPVWNTASTNGASVVGSPTIVVGQGSRLFMTTGSLLLFTGCEL